MLFDYIDTTDQMVEVARQEALRTHIAAKGADEAYSKLLESHWSLKVGEAVCRRHWSRTLAVINWPGGPEEVRLEDLRVVALGIVYVELLVTGKTKRGRWRKARECHPVRDIIILLQPTLAFKQAYEEAAISVH